MRKPLVAANWKMHGSRELVKSYFPCLQNRVAGSDMDVVVFPPFVYLQQAAEYVSAPVMLGAQNLCEEERGAFTGEISAEMLVEASCQYVLVGHSERRVLFGETDLAVAKKFVIAIKAGLTPILCIGESLHQRESGDTLAAVRAQLGTVIGLAGLHAVSESVIAYEPVWAIGTGMTATPEQAQEVHRDIRSQLGVSGRATRILYGGSVKPENAAELFSQPDIDGGLVGGASLDAEEFAAICDTAQRK